MSENARVLTFFEMNEIYLVMIQELWNSIMISPEEQRWLDDISIKKSFKLSERDRIKRLYIQVFGKLPGQLGIK